MIIVFILRVSGINRKEQTAHVGNGLTSFVLRRDNTNMKITLKGLENHAGVTEISRQLGIEVANHGILIEVEKSGSGIVVSYDGTIGRIIYNKQHELYRGLGLVLELIKSNQVGEIKETPFYDNLGVMFDCSRNAVLKLETFHKLIRQLALMGYSTVQLYTEDTYEIKEYPYFGYMRGKYTSEQMKKMDQYAEMFGIELVPCIQTLAHLGTALKWNAFSDIVDCNDILLIDNEKTYDLIESMFKVMAQNLTSRKINIGMDEAHMMGLGKYLDQHGYQDRSKLMLKHFTRVVEIARKYGYEPMMWSDMFFRLASSGEYYDTNSPINEDIINMIPTDVSLVYWDYYSVEPEKYDGMLKKHKQMSDNIIFAGGAWKWMGFSPNNHFSANVGKMAHSSCVKNGITEVLITAWGDNGAEASTYSILPTLQLWAELCYRDDADEERLKERFSTCVGGSYEDFMNLDMTMMVPDNKSLDVHSLNPPKYLLYQDILCGLFDKHVLPKEYAAHYKKCGDSFESCISRNPSFKEIFQTQLALSRLLELKCDAGIEIRDAYLNNDRVVLEKYGHTLLPDLKIRAEEFHIAYHAQWTDENKIFGLDVFDLRMGGLILRLQSAINRINEYLEGDLEYLEELEQKLLYFDGREKESDKVVTSYNLWHNIATASALAGI
ncbi:beta-N-acetylhexosaminidase [Aquibacillus halophilus]|uniref:beta-N-acetylhexosaminidase n=1 Tax=Aquibacillus halophilus TaxID=930132 RepID=UPI00196B8AFE|nr:beta-N-acetylhexosaminidase [Aquibacillus halophilus]